MLFACASSNYSFFVFNSDFENYALAIIFTSEPACSQRFTGHRKPNNNAKAWFKLCHGSMWMTGQVPALSWSHIGWIHIYIYKTNLTVCIRYDFKFGYCSLVRESQFPCNSNWKSCVIGWTIIFLAALMSSFQPKKQEVESS